MHPARPTHLPPGQLSDPAGGGHSATRFPDEEVETVLILIFFLTVHPSIHHLSFCPPIHLSIIYILSISLSLTPDFELTQVCCVFCRATLFITHHDTLGRERRHGSYLGLPWQCLGTLGCAAWGEGRWSGISPQSLAHHKGPIKACGVFYQRSQKGW